MKVQGKKTVLLTAVSMAMLFSAATNAAVSPIATRYEPITTQEIKNDATTAFDLARAAGRLQAKDIEKLQADLNAAGSLADVEAVWANIEANAQVAKERHQTLDNLLNQFQAKLNTLQRKGIVPSEGWKFYTDRLAGIRRIQKMLINKKDHNWIFWDYVSLAVDLSSVEERLTRTLSGAYPELETTEDLMLRTENYMARNSVAARGLTTYKSFEVEPDELQNAKHGYYTVLQDKAHSRLKTPEVKYQLERRLKSIHYEAARVLPSETDIDKAIVEVQRLLDSGARNGHLSALDDVRIQHELELIKQLKNAYPGPTPGIDPIEKELRMEQVRFMSLDLRFLQDWLGRILRADGDTQEAREQIMRVITRADLAWFSHRITHADALGVLEQVNKDIQNYKSDAELTAAAKRLQRKLDFMISDFSMVPAKTTLRYTPIAADVNRLRTDRDQAAQDLDHASRLVDSVNRLNEGPQKYGQSIVAATELELIRSRVQPLLQAQR